MADTASQNSKTTAAGESFVAISNRAVLILLAGMASAWFAAGSMGLFGHALRHALTWIALGTAIVAAWPTERRDYRAWRVLVVGAILGVAFTASPLTAVNVLAVAVVLAAISLASGGLTARLALIGAMAATVLACFRLACHSIPFVWQTADRLGWALGQTAAWLSGSQLEIGSTFAGVDFLVLAAAIYAGWLFYTPPPRGPRAIWAAAIAAGQIVYLLALANAEKLLEMIPATAVPFDEGNNHVGLWTINNALRSMIPWQLPLLAAAIQGAIAAVMVSSTQWLPASGPGSPEYQRRQQEDSNEELSGSALAADMLLRFGPVLLAVAAVLFAALTTDYANLEGKTVVAYDRGYPNDWLKPEYDAEADGYYGLLPAFVESLGGKFIASKELAAGELEKADLLLLIHPDRPFPPETLERIWEYVRGGGAMLLAAGPVAESGDSRGGPNAVLEPLSMRVRREVLISRTEGWEQSHQDSSHPAAIGLNDSRNPFGLWAGVSLETGWLARPLLVGRWGWAEPESSAADGGAFAYNAGDRFGDAPLAAEQSFGGGRVVLLGETTPLQNEQLSSSYRFVGRLFGYLANRQSSPWTWWRQTAALAALAATIVLLACRLDAWQLIVVPGAMAAALVWTTAASDHAGRVLPDGRIKPVNNAAYIDASHLESYSHDPWLDYGIIGLQRVLMRQGYLPLLAPDLNPDRLARCGLVISIGPLKAFSPDQRKAIDGFVSSGGTMICLVGAEEAGASAPLLADFGLRVPYAPVPTGDDAAEPVPFGGGISGRTQTGESVGFFHAAWPVESLDDRAEMLVYWSEGDRMWNLVLRQTKGRGSFVVVGDTHNAANKIFEMNETEATNFWRWLLGRTVAGQKPWNPPTAKEGESNADSELNESGIDDAGGDSAE